MSFMLRRVLSLVTIAIFFTQTTGFGQLSAQPSLTIDEIGAPEPSVREAFSRCLRIEIPSELGEITARFENPQQKAFLVQIQDAHGSYEAQKNIAGIAEHLRGKYGMKILFLEGGAGELNPGLFDFFEDARLNLEVADDLMKQGEFTGAEMALLERAGTDEGLKGYGIEKEDLYREDLKLFREVLGRKEASSVFLETAGEKIELIGSRVFSNDLRDFVREWRKWHGSQKDLMRFLGVLYRQSLGTLSLDLEDPGNQGSYPMLVRYFTLKRTENARNPGKIQIERDDFLRFLEGKISGELFREVALIGEHGALEGKTSLRFLLEKVAAELLPKGIEFPDFPNLFEWFKFQILESEIRSSSLFDEIERMTEDILNGAAKSEREKRLVRILTDRLLLEKLLNLELSRQDYEKIRADAEDLRPSRFCERFREFGVDPGAFSSGADLEELFNRAEAFYRLAEEREAHFLENAFAVLTGKKEGAGILVTGGFHTGGLERKLREKGISYISIRPRIKEIGNSQEVYLGAILGTGARFEESQINIVPALTGLGKQGKLGWDRGNRSGRIANSVARVQAKYPEAVVNQRNPYLTEQAALKAASLGGTQTPFILREGLPQTVFSRQGKRIVIPTAILDQLTRMAALARKLRVELDATLLLDENGTVTGVDCLRDETKAGVVETELPAEVEMNDPTFYDRAYAQLDLIRRILNQEESSGVQGALISFLQDFETYLRDYQARLRLYPVARNERIDLDAEFVRGVIEDFQTKSWKEIQESSFSMNILNLEVLATEWWASCPFLYPQRPEGVETISIHNHPNGFPSPPSAFVLESGEKYGDIYSGGFMNGNLHGLLLGTSGGEELFLFYEPDASREQTYRDLFTKFWDKNINILPALRKLSMSSEQAASLGTDFDSESPGDANLLAEGKNAMTALAETLPPKIGSSLGRVTNTSDKGAELRTTKESGTVGWEKKRSWGPEADLRLIADTFLQNFAVFFTLPAVLLSFLSGNPPTALRNTSTLFGFIVASGGASIYSIYWFDKFLRFRKVLSRKPALREVSTPKSDAGNKILSLLPTTIISGIGFSLLNLLAAPSVRLPILAGWLSVTALTIYLSLSSRPLSLSGSERSMFSDKIKLMLFKTGRLFFGSLNLAALAVLGTDIARNQIPFSFFFLTGYSLFEYINNYVFTLSNKEFGFLLVMYPFRLLQHWFFKTPMPNPKLMGGVIGREIHKLEKRLTSSSKPELRQSPSMTDSKGETASSLGGTDYDYKTAGGDVADGERGSIPSQRLKEPLAEALSEAVQGIDESKIGVQFPNARSLDPRLPSEARALYGQYPEVKKLYDTSLEYLRTAHRLPYSLEDLFLVDFEADQKDLVLVHLAMFLYEMALYRALESQMGRGFRPGYLAGMSAGIWAALVVSEATTMEGMMDFIIPAAQVLTDMQSIDLGYIVISRTSRQEIISLLKPGQVELLEDFSPDHVVLTVHQGEGYVPIKDVASEIQRKLSCTTQVFYPLDFKAPHHTFSSERFYPRMKAAADRLNIQKPKIPIFPSTLENESELNIDAIRFELSEGLLFRPILWSNTVSRMKEAGARIFIQVGSGNRIPKMNRRMNREDMTLNMDSREAMKAIAQKVMASNAASLGDRQEAEGGDIRDGKLKLPGNIKLLIASDKDEAVRAVDEMISNVPTRKAAADLEKWTGRNLAQIAVNETYPAGAQKVREIVRALKERGSWLLYQEYESGVRAYWTGYVGNTLVPLYDELPEAPALLRLSFEEKMRKLDEIPYLRQLGRKHLILVKTLAAYFHLNFNGNELFITSSSFSETLNVLRMLLRLENEISPDEIQSVRIIPEAAGIIESRGFLHDFTHVGRAVPFFELIRDKILEAGYASEDFGKVIDQFSLFRTDFRTIQGIFKMADLNRRDVHVRLMVGLRDLIDEGIVAYRDSVELLRRVDSDVFPDREEVKAYCQAAETSLEILGKLKEGIEAFITGKVPEKKPFDVRHSLRTVADFFFREESSTLPHLELRFPEDLPAVFGDEHHIDRVWLNLIKNALDATEVPATQENKNIIRIEAEISGAEVIVRVSDTGAGIPPEILERIWEPDFTTKGEKGTGLGLPVAKQIVEQSGGTISVESEVGKGTTFTVRLPLHEMWSVMDTQTGQQTGFVYVAPRAPDLPSFSARAWNDFHEMAFEFPKLLREAREKNLPVILAVPEELDGLGPLAEQAPWVEGARVALTWASAYFRFKELGGVDVRILRVPGGMTRTDIQAAAAELLSRKIEDVPELSPEQQLEKRVFSAEELLAQETLVAGGVEFSFAGVASEKARVPVKIQPKLQPLRKERGQKRIVVTGGAGFIGANLARRLLAEGHQVIVLDSLVSGEEGNLSELRENPDFYFEQTDVALPFDIEGPVDQIVHLASLASPAFYYTKPEETLRAGLQGTREALELARRKNARFIYSSTSEVYGDPEVHPQVENYAGRVNPIGKRSQYDESKRGAETLIKLYFEKYAAEGLDVRMVRLFNTYGPFMRVDDGRVVTNFIQAALNGGTLQLYGGGRQTRSFGYIDDTLEGILAVLRSDSLSGEKFADRRVFNIGNPGEFTIRELADKVNALSLKYLGREVSIRDVPQPDADDPKLRRPDITRASNAVGFQPRTLLDEGLEKTFLFFYGRFSSGTSLDGKAGETASSLGRSSVGFLINDLGYHLNAPTGLAIDWETKSFGTASGFLELNTNDDLFRIFCHADPQWVKQYPNLDPLTNPANDRGLYLKSPVGSFGQLILEFHSLPVWDETRPRERNFLPVALIREVQPGDGLRAIKDPKHRRQLDAWREKTLQAVLAWAKSNGVEVFASSSELIGELHPDLNEFEVRTNYERPFQNGNWQKISIPTRLLKDEESDLYGFVPDLMLESGEEYPWHVYTGNQSFQMLQENASSLGDPGEREEQARAAALEKYEGLYARLMAVKEYPDAGGLAKVLRGFRVLPDGGYVTREFEDGIYSSIFRIHDQVTIDEAKAEFRSFVDEIADVFPPEQRDQINVWEVGNDNAHVSAVVFQEANALLKAPAPRLTEEDKDNLRGLLDEMARETHPVSLHFVGYGLGPDGGVIRLYADLSGGLFDFCERLRIRAEEITEGRTSSRPKGLISMTVGRILSLPYSNEPRVAEAQRAEVARRVRERGKLYREQWIENLSPGIQPVLTFEGITWLNESQWLTTRGREPDQYFPFEATGASLGAGLSGPELEVDAMEKTRENLLRAGLSRKEIRNLEDYTRSFLRKHKQSFRQNREELLQSLADPNRLSIALRPHGLDVVHEYSKSHRDFLNGLASGLVAKLFVPKLLAGNREKNLRRFLIEHLAWAEGLSTDEEEFLSGLYRQVTLSKQGVTVERVEDYSSKRGWDEGDIVYKITLGKAGRNVSFFLKGLGGGAENRRNRVKRQADKYEAFFSKLARILGKNFVEAWYYPEQEDAHMLGMTLEQEIDGKDSNVIFDHAPSERTFRVKGEFLPREADLISEFAGFAAIHDLLQKSDRRMIQNRRPQYHANFMISPTLWDQGGPAVYSVDQDRLFKSNNSGVVMDLERAGEGEMGILAAFDEFARPSGREHLLREYETAYLGEWDALRKRMPQIEALIREFFGEGSLEYQIFSKTRNLDPEENLRIQKEALLRFVEFRENSGASLGQKVPGEIQGYATEHRRDVSAVLWVTEKYAGRILYLPDADQAVFSWFLDRLGLGEEVERKEIGKEFGAFNISLEPAWKHLLGQVPDAAGGPEGKVPILLEEGVFKGEPNPESVAGKIASTMREGDLVAVLWDGERKPKFLSELYRVSGGRKFRVKDLMAQRAGGTAVGQLLKGYDVPALWIGSVSEEEFEISFREGDKVKLNLRLLADHGVDPAQVVALLRQIADYPALRQKLFLAAGLTPMEGYWEVGKGFVNLIQSIYQTQAAQKALKTAA